MNQNMSSRNRLPPQLKLSGNHRDPKYVFGCDTGENCGICQICLDKKILGTTYSNASDTMMVSLPYRNLTDEIWRRLIKVRYDEYNSNEITQGSNTVASQQVPPKVVKRRTPKRVQKKKVEGTATALSSTPTTTATAATVTAASTTETLRCSGRVEGVSWGCGQTFAVMDGLKAHWASPAGTPCLEQFVRLRRGNKH